MIVTTALHSIHRDQNVRPLGMARAVVLLIGLVGWSGVASGWTDPPASAPAPPLFRASRVFRAQSPELFALPPGEGVEPPPAPAAAPLSLEAPPASDLPAIAAPAFKSTPGFDDSPGAGDGRIGCKTCGGMGQFPASNGSGFRSCASCGGSGCIPGRAACAPYEGHSFFGRFSAELYQSLCCPDPCYEPGWVPAANAAFFMDYARPRTVIRVRNDYGWNLQFPDRSEFFWARQQIQTRKAGQISSINGGRGPGRPSRFPAKRAYRGVASVDYDQVSYYNEIAANSRASLFVETPYRISDPSDGNNYHAGFSDINFGTKGVIFDTELLLLTIQFKTYSPVGNARFGLGTGHFSLEPSLLGALKLGPDTFLQGQIAEWIPIGGDPNYQGSVLHYHGSLNHVLFRVAANSPIIGTLETNAWSFQDGLYTDPNGRPVNYRKSSGMTYANIGPGIRASICDKVDFGGAIAFPLSEPSFANPILRLEFRILY